mgnify:CR=1 FL=1
MHRRVGRVAEARRGRQYSSSLKEFGRIPTFLGRKVPQLEVDMESLEKAKDGLPHVEDCPSCSEALPQEGGVNY